MKLKNLKAVILAAGESSRFWPLNSKHKSLIKIMERPLIWYTLEGLRRSGIKEAMIVQSPKKEIEGTLKNYDLKNLKIKFLIQKKPKGTGNALWQTRNFLKDNFFVLNGDVVNSQELVREILKKFEKTKSKAVLVGQKTQTPELFGMMRLKKDRILDIIEKPKKGKEPSDIKVVGVYLLTPNFFNFYQKVKKHPYDFEDALSLYMKENETKVALLQKLEKDTPSFLKYPWHLFLIRKYLFDNALKGKISKFAKISKNTIIQGKVFIGEGVKIFEGAVIKGPCYIGENSIIGNNSLIRDYTDLEKNILIGAYAEVTRSVFQEGATTHSGYFGDSILGKDCKIGAGTITGNVRLDGENIKSIVKGEKVDIDLKSFGAVLGENTKIGIHVSLMPGVLIGKNSIIGPHSLVVKNIEDNTLFYTKHKVVKKQLY